MLHLKLEKKENVVLRMIEGERWSDFKRRPNGFLSRSDIAQELIDWDFFKEKKLSNVTVVDG